MRSTNEPRRGKEAVDSKEWENLMDILADSLEPLAADAPLEENDGLNAEVVVRGEAVRQLLLGEVSNYRKHLAEEAMRHHAATIAEFLKHPYALPSDASAQRMLLHRVMTEYPHLQSSLTLQHRDFKTLSDSDVESLLRQLAALGVFEDL